MNLGLHSSNGILRRKDWMMIRSIRESQGFWQGTRDEKLVIEAPLSMALNKELTISDINSKGL